jgi:uncharacterized membrane protein
MTASTLDLRQIRPLIDRKVAILYLGLALGIAPIWPFEWHLALHVLGAILLIGNALAMAVWLVIAGSSGNDAWKRRAARAVNVGDVSFTVPGVALILANGLAMVVERYGGVTAFTSTPFVGVGLVLLTATGLVWALRLVPTQLAMLLLARATGPLVAAAFQRRLVTWFAWGTLATILPIAAVVVMSVKPALW